MRVCEIAGFVLFELKSAECIETLGFSGVTPGGTLFAKKLLVFRGSVRSLPFISSLGKSPLTILGQRGVVLGGVLGKTLQARECFQQSHAICPYEDSIAVLHGCSQKKISHSLTAT